MHLQRFAFVWNVSESERQKSEKNPPLCGGNARIHTSFPSPLACYSGEGPGVRTDCSRSLPASPLSCWDYLIDPFDKNRRYIAQTDIGFSRSVDGGERWIWGGPALPKGVDNTTYQIVFDPEIKGKIFGAFGNARHPQLQHDLRRSLAAAARGWGSGREPRPRRHVEEALADEAAGHVDRAGPQEPQGQSDALRCPVRGRRLALQRRRQDVGTVQERGPRQPKEQAPSQAHSFSRMARC